MKTLREMDRTIEEIKRSLQQFEIGELILPNRADRNKRKASDNDYLMLKVAIFGSFYPNYFIRSHGNLDMKLVHKEINEKDPMNTLYLMGFPSEQARYGELYVNQIKEIFKVWFLYEIVIEKLRLEDFFYLNQEFWLRNFPLPKYYSFL